MNEGNYYCSSLLCDYRTLKNLDFNVNLDEKLKQDGGFDNKVSTRCPKCGGCSLVYIPYKYFKGYENPNYFRIK